MANYLINHPYVMKFQEKLNIETQCCFVADGHIDVMRRVMCMKTGHRSSVFKTLPDFTLCLFIWPFLSSVLHLKNPVTDVMLS